MKSINLILGPLAAALSTAAGASATVSTHAYVYVYAGVANPTSVAILLDQGSAVSLLGCALAGGNVPKTAEDISTLLAGGTCADDLSGPIFAAAPPVIKLVHQPSSDRIAFEASGTSWTAPTSGAPSTVTSIAMTAVFDRKSPDQFSYVYTYIATIDGSNPNITTNNGSSLRAFDAVILYPALPTNVIEP